MSEATHGALQVEHGDRERASRAADLSDRALQFEVIPNVCLIPDVCRILRISRRQFEYLDARRELAIVELRRLDRKRRFSGESVAREARRRA
jgi:hypothetical protein